MGMLLCHGAPLDATMSLVIERTFMLEHGVVERDELPRAEVTVLDLALLFEQDNTEVIAQLLAWGALPRHPHSRLAMRHVPEAAARAIELLASREQALLLAGAAARSAAERARGGSSSCLARAGKAEARRVVGGRGFLLVTHAARSAARAAGAERLAALFRADALEGLADALRVRGAGLALAAVRLAKSERARQAASEAAARAGEALRVAHNLLTVRMPAVREFIAQCSARDAMNL
jgi:Xaa-Pro aminopeptidase